MMGKELEVQYPLELSFKIIALWARISVTDASGRPIFHVKQRPLKLKEEVVISADEGQRHPLYKINADRWLDWSAEYHFRDLDGDSLGTVRREGWKSLWRARYQICEWREDGNSQVSSPVMTIQEDDPWVKVMDTLFSAIPYIRYLSGYVFHPAYVVKRSNGQAVMRLEKRPALFENKFIIKRRKGISLDKNEEVRILLSLMMMIVLERSRG